MTRTAKTSLVALTATCAALVLSAPGAQAAIIHPFLGSFGPGGSGAGTFGRVEGVAVEQSTQDVYIYDASEGGRIYKFDAEGEPIDFSGTASNVIEGVGQAGNGEAELAVDDSAGPDKGDIYAANNAEVVVYSAAGVKLGSLSGGEMCGVAVDSAGHVYVGIYGETVRQYVPAANPVTNADYLSALWGLNGICNVAVDGEGSVYAATYSGGVRKYAPSQFNTTEEPAVSIPLGTAFDEQGRTLAVDRSGSVLYADNGNTITEYDDEAEPTLQGSFGMSRLDSSFGVAADETSGDIYAGSESRAQIYGPTSTAADVSLEAPATGIGQSSVTVHGTVDPLGIAVSRCQFEYWSEQESEALSTPCTPSPGSANSPVAVSATLSGLSDNTTYHYRLAATDTNATNYSETSTFTTLLSPPTLSGQTTSSGLTRTTAQVTATVGTSGAPTTVAIEYVTSGEYRPEAANPYARGASTPSIVVKASPNHTVGPIGIIALAPGTTYHYRLAAHNAAGTTLGQDGTFTTAPPTPPAVTTGSVGEVTQTSALLTGAVQAQGLQTSYEFEIGTDTTYSGGKLFGNAGQSAGAENVSTPLQFLVPGVTYHYRLVATNEDGTTYGQDVTFTTPGVPTPITQPPTASLISSPTVTFPTITEPANQRTTTKTKTKKHKRHSAKRRGKAKHAAKRRGAKPGGGKRR